MLEVLIMSLGVTDWAGLKMDLMFTEVSHNSSNESARGKSVSAKSLKDRTAECACMLGCIEVGQKFALKTFESKWWVPRSSTLRRCAKTWPLKALGHCDTRLKRHGKMMIGHCRWSMPFNKND